MSMRALARDNREESVVLGAGAAPARSTRRLVPPGVERLFGVLLLVGAWQLASTVGLIDEQTLAGPMTVLRIGWQLLQDGTLQSAIWVSLQRVMLGLAIGIPVGTVLALLAGLWRIGEDTI